MPSLRQLSGRHSSILLIDSSSTCVQAGLLVRDRTAFWSAQPGEAGEQLFVATNDVLAQAATALDAIDAFVFCDGPGSVLGIRTAAVTVRTWNVLRARPVYAFCSLAAIAHALSVTQKQRNFSVIADARRDTWHHIDVDAQGHVSSLKRLPSSALSGPLFMPEGFRHWTPLPAGLHFAPYSLAALLPALVDVDLFGEAPEPDAFLHEEPAYQTWTPQIHRAPAASSS